MSKTKVIFDLEAACEEREINPDFDKETIEIGAVKVENGKVIDTFQTFIKPVRNPVLTDFCKNLTHIKQSDVDNAPSYAQAIESFKKWADGAELLSWGAYDRKQLTKDSERHGLETKWIQNHRDIKREHQKIKGLTKPVGVKAALRGEKMSFEGTHHRGIDDAKNIARIYFAVFPEVNKKTSR